MKKIKISALILVLGLVTSFTLTSCEDFLDSENYTQADTSNFPTSPKDCDNLLAACYAVMNQIQNNPLCAPWFVADLMSDDMFGAGGENDNEVKAISHLTIYSSTMFDAMWTCGYRGIFRANTIIETADNCNWKGDTASRDQVVGEAYFMRALYYLWISQAFGDVPMPLSTAVPDPCPQQSAKDVIFPQIIADCYTAYQLMSQVKDGHANKYAAAALMARAYMFYEGFYCKNTDLATAKPEALALPTQQKCEGVSLSKDDVVAALKVAADNDGSFGLVGDFRNLYQYTNALTVDDYWYTKDAIGVDGQPLLWAGNGNKEELFAIHYANTSSWNSAASEKMCYANEISLYVGLRCDADADGDVNGSAKTFPWARGWGQGAAATNFWNDWKAYDATDLRREASILDCDGELTAKSGVYDWTASKYAHVTTGVEDPAFSIKKLLPVTTMHKEDGTINDWSSDCPWWGMLNVTNPSFASSNGQDLQGSHFQDTYLIRMADVYLMISELTGDATYMNKVRARAGLAPISYSLAALQNERRFELCFEGLRFNDLRRWSGIDGGENCYAAKALEKKNGQPVTHRGTQAGETKHTTCSWAKRYADTNGFLPKPETQILLVGDTDVFSQNAGWNNRTECYYVNRY